MQWSRAFLSVMIAYLWLGHTGAVAQDSIVKYYQRQLEKTGTPTQRADLYMKLGQQYAERNQEHKGIEAYQQALRLYQDTENDLGAMEANYGLFTLLSSQQNLDIDPLPYLRAYSANAEKQGDSSKLLKAQMSFAQYYFNTDFAITKAHYDKAKKLAVALEDSLQLANIYTNLGLLYSGYVGQDSARSYFERSLKMFPEANHYERFITYLNYANSFQKDSLHERAIVFLKKAESITPQKHQLNLQKVLFSKFSNSYESLGDYQKAFHYYDLYNTVRDSINLKQQNIDITNITEAYDNEKLRADNLEIEAKRKQNRNLLWTSLGILVFMVVTGTLTLKNSKRKRKLAEQEKTLQTQKLATALKDQELKAIDAMLEGQEKERQRIANDLHDDLGSLMTTVKWHFNKLQEQPSPELLAKTDQLLDDAYQKIRGIAHAKNAGVIAKQGLLPAVQQMARALAIHKSLTIEVHEYGLEQRLENSLELTIFRMLQELLANVIKHADATEVNIHLINHGDSLNIMIEDNGKGFDSRQLTKTNSGMGLTTIEKRVEYLNGRMSIESEPQQGTSIIIDIPVS